MILFSTLVKKSTGKIITILINHFDGKNGEK